MLYACSCEKRCSVTVDAGDELEALDEAEADCEAAPWECECQPLPDEIEEEG